MEKVKSKVIFFIIVILVIPINVFAHPGGLDSSGCHHCRKNCAKWGLETDEYHCHNGNTYSNSKGEVYDKSGSKISSGNTTNNNSSEKNESDNNNNNIISEKPANNNGNFNSSTSETNSEISITKPIEKSNDVSLKIVKVDDNEITIDDLMQYETNNKRINLSVETTNIKAKVEFNNPNLTIGKNEILIKLTAEAGNCKEYKLIVNRKEVQSTVVIKKFILGSSEVVFENNKATIKKLTNETKFEYSYELSDKNAKLLLYINDKEVTKLNNIKNDDFIKLVIVDTDDNKNIYEIRVTEFSKIESAIINGMTYTIVGIILLVPVAIVVAIVCVEKKKKLKDE